MFVRRSLFPALAALVTAALAGTSHAQSNSKEIMALPEAGLVKILQSADAPVFDKAKACQRLAVIGTEKAIPALAALLADEKLNLYGRFGLEGIPGPAPDRALREATRSLQGRQLVGVIDSIGQRKDAQAVSLLEGFLSNSDPKVASAAAGALGRIGNPEAAVALQARLAGGSAVVNCVADAALACAEGLAAAGSKDGAVALYQAVAKARVPKHLRLGAIDGQLRLLGEEGKDLLMAQIRSKDQAFFDLGLAAARRVPGAATTAALTAELPKLPATRQGLLLRALGDRKEGVSMAALLSAAKSPAEEVREAAVVVLARRGDASAVPVLVAAALGEGDAAQLAKEGLKTLAAAEADQAILERLRGADARAKATLLELIGARRIVAAAPAVKGALDDADESVRLAALGAWGQLADLEGMNPLLARSLAEGDAKQKAAAREALKMAALRMSDREAAAALLAAKFKTAQGENEAFLMELLGKVSGPTALKTIVAAARSADARQKDVATKVLGEWVNAEAAPALLEIAKTEADAKYQTRALRGYIRIARQLQLPAAEKLAMFRTAMEVARRNDERQVALDILSRIPSVETLELAVAHLGKPGLKQAAADAAVKIAAKLLSSEPKTVAAAMQKVVAAKAGGKPGAQAQQLLDQARANSK